MVGLIVLVFIPVSFGITLSFFARNYNVHDGVERVHSCRGLNE